MQQVPTDGSYYDSHHSCDRAFGEPPNCTGGGNTIVRKLNLDRSIEGAHVFLCKLHWNTEMKQRQWMNDHGIAEPWDVFDFFEPNPQTPVAYKATEPEEVKEIDAYYPVVNYAAMYAHKGMLRDVFVTFMNMNDVLVSMRYKHMLDITDMANAIREARDHMVITRRAFGLVSIFENSEDSNQLSLTRELCDYVYEAIHVNGRGVLKYV